MWNNNKLRFSIWKTGNSSEWMSWNDLENGHYSCTGSTLFFNRVFSSLYLGSGTFYIWHTHFVVSLMVVLLLLLLFTMSLLLLPMLSLHIYINITHIHTYVSAERNFSNTVTWMGYFSSATVWQQTITTLFTIWFSIRVYVCATFW